MTGDGLTLCLAALVAVLLLESSGRTQALQEAELTAHDAAASDFFGNAVSVSGDTAIVGAAHAGLGVGAAYVFVRSGTGWIEQARLTASDGLSDDAFGSSVTVLGDTAIVGASGDDQGSKADTGSAYVFVRSGTTWSEQAKLTAQDASQGDNFGISVALSGETVVVGADQFVPFTATGPGAAYVFVRSGTSWSQQAKLTASDAVHADEFGHAVSIDGDTAVAGAFLDDHAAGIDAGSAYVFVRAGSAWAQQAKLTASDASAGDGFGDAVAVSGGTVLVGAAGDSHVGGAFAGSAYVFVYSGNTWVQQVRLVAADAAADDLFGTSVALSGEVALVGAAHDSHSGGNLAGSASVFERTGSSWSQAGKLVASDAAFADFFGTAVAISGTTAVIGAYNHNTGAGFHAGSAYTFSVLDPAAGAWVDLGQGLAGVQGVPRLAGSGPLVGGSMVQLTLTKAKPGGAATLVVGLTPVNAPFKGGVLVPDADLVFSGLAVGSTGALLLQAAWPAGVPSLWSAWYQVWIVDAVGPSGLSASNGVQSTAP